MIAIIFVAVHLAKSIGATAVVRARHRTKLFEAEGLVVYVEAGVIFAKLGKILPKIS